jgi:hypothetical protein
MGDLLMAELRGQSSQLRDAFEGLGEDTAFGAANLNSVLDWLRNIPGAGWVIDQIQAFIKASEEAIAWTIQQGKDLAASGVAAAEKALAGDLGKLLRFVASQMGPPIDQIVYALPQMRACGDEPHSKQAACYMVTILSAVMASYSEFQAEVMIAVSAITGDYPTAVALAVKFKARQLAAALTGDAREVCLGLAASTDVIQSMYKDPAKAFEDSAVVGKLGIALAGFGHPQTVIARVGRCLAHNSSIIAKAVEKKNPVDAEVMKLIEDRFLAPIRALQEVAGVTVMKLPSLPGGFGTYDGVLALGALPGLTNVVTTLRTQAEDLKLVADAITGIASVFKSIGSIVGELPIVGGLLRDAMNDIGGVISDMGSYASKFADTLGNPEALLALPAGKMSTADQATYQSKGSALSSSAGAQSSANAADRRANTQLDVVDAVNTADSADRLEYLTGVSPDVTCAKYLGGAVQEGSMCDNWRVGKIGTIRTAKINGTVPPSTPPGLYEMIAVTAAQWAATHGGKASGARTVKVKPGGVRSALPPLKPIGVSSSLKTPGLAPTLLAAQKEALAREAERSVPGLAPTLLAATLGAGAGLLIAGPPGAIVGAGAGLLINLFGKR